MKLFDLANEIRETHNPKKDSKEYLYIGLEHILPQDLHIDFYSYSNITESLKYKFKKDDIIFGTMRPYFKKIAKTPFDGVCSTEFSVIRPKQKSDCNYVFYLLAQDIFIKFCNINSKGDRPRVKWKQFSKFKVNHKNKVERFLIGNILSVYDSLIDINRKRIQLLEESAQLLYREWFVYFRFPGHQQVKFVDGIPEGWEKARLDQVWDISYGKNLSTNKIKKLGKFPVVGADTIIGYYDKKNVENSLCLVTCRGNGCGNIRRTYGPSFVTNNSFIFKSNDTFSHINFLITMFMLENKKLRNYITGAAQPQLTLSNIRNIKVLIPEKQLILKYLEVAKDLIQNSDKLKIQNQKLAQARDLLLPRLMSGKIDVSELNKKRLKEAGI